MSQSPMAEEERYLVLTEHGRVWVVVRADRGGLDPELIEVRPVDESEGASAAEPGDDRASAVTMETPLRAFAAKMVDLVQVRGTDPMLSPALRDLMIKEKAAEDLRRIERTAKRLHQDAT